MISIPVVLGNDVVGMRGGAPDGDTFVIWIRTETLGWQRAVVKMWAGDTVSIKDHDGALPAFVIERGNVDIPFDPVKLSEDLVLTRGVK